MYKFYFGATASDSDSVLEEGRNHDERRYPESDLFSAKILPYQLKRTYSKKQIEADRKAKTVRKFCSVWLAYWLF